MSWIAVGASAAIAGVQYGVGKYNQKKSEKNRPDYQIPDEIGQNLNQAQQRSIQGLPAAQQQQYLNNLQQNSAYALQQTSNRKGGLSGIAAINQQNIQGNQGLLAMNAQARSQNLDKLSAARQNMADYKQQEFQINKLNPYYEKIASNQALNGALFQNLNNSVGMGALIGMQKRGTNPVAYNNQYVDMNKINQQQGSFGNMGTYNPGFNPNGIIYDGGNNGYDITS